MFAVSMNAMLRPNTISPTFRWTSRSANRRHEAGRRQPGRLTQRRRRARRRHPRSAGARPDRSGTRSSACRQRPRRRRERGDPRRSAPASRAPVRPAPRRRSRTRSRPAPWRGPPSSAAIRRASGAGRDRRDWGRWRGPARRARPRTRTPATSRSARRRIPPRRPRPARSASSPACRGPRRRRRAREAPRSRGGCSWRRPWARRYRCRTCRSSHGGPATQVAFLIAAVRRDRRVGQRRTRGAYDRTGRLRRARTGIARPLRRRVAGAADRAGSVRAVRGGPVDAAGQKGGDGVGGRGNSGALVHFGAAALGISAIVATSAAAFAAVKWAGAAYLVFLGVRTWLERGSEQSTPADAPKRSLRRVAAQGVVVTVLNPKLALFVLAFVPQFLDPARGPVAAQTLVLGAIFVALAAMTDSLYALSAGWLGSALRRRKGAARAQRWLTGTVYVGLGVAAAAGHAAPVAD